MIRITHAHGSTLLSPQILTAYCYEIENRGGWTSVMAENPWMRFSAGVYGPLEIAWEDAIKCLTCYGSGYKESVAYHYGRIECPSCEGSGEADA